MLNIWSPASGTILGDSRNFKEWSLAVAKRAVEYAFESGIWSLVPFSPCSLAVMK